MSPPGSILLRSSGRSRSRLRRRLVALPEAERVPFGVLAGGEPAVPLHRQLVLCRTAELAHLRDRAIDVGSVEVDGERPRLLTTDDRAALVLAGPEHPVVHLGRHRRPDLPAEDAAPESLRAVRVCRVDLDVHELACHRSSFGRVIVPPPTTGRESCTGSSFSTKRRPTPRDMRTTSNASARRRMVSFGTAWSAAPRWAS